MKQKDNEVDTKQFDQLARNLSVNTRRGLLGKVLGGVLGATAAIVSVSGFETDAKKKRGSGGKKRRKSKGKGKNKNKQKLVANTGGGDVCLHSKESGSFDGCKPVCTTKCPGAGQACEHDICGPLCKVGTEDRQCDCAKLCDPNCFVCDGEHGATFICSCEDECVPEECPTAPICQKATCHDDECKNVADSGQNGQICSENPPVCKKKVCDNGDCTAVADPEQNGDACGEGLCCDNGQCVECSQQCVPAECPTAPICKKAICHEDECKNVRDDSQNGQVCGEQAPICQKQVCYDGDCANKPDSSQNGQSCGEGLCCDNGQCVQCAHQCVVEECPTAPICQKATCHDDECKNVADSGQNGQACGEGLCCDNGACVACGGETCPGLCQTNEQCAAHGGQCVCFTGVSAAVITVETAEGVCGECLTNGGHCTSSLECCGQLVCNGGVCGQKPNSPKPPRCKKHGHDCSSDRQCCAQGVCIRGRCGEKDTHCKNNNECAKGWSCVGGDQTGSHRRCERNGRRHQNRRRREGRRNGRGKRN